jgi:hypothetical protein
MPSPNSKSSYQRKDQMGNTIKHGSKRHKVTFVDQVQKKSIAEVFFVESYKKYNSDESSSTSHCCLIFWDN